MNIRSIQNALRAIHRIEKLEVNQKTKTHRKKGSSAKIEHVIFQSLVHTFEPDQKVHNIIEMLSKSQHIFVTLQQTAENQCR